MVPSEPHAEHGGLVDDVWVELDASERHSGCIERRFSETDSWPTRDRLGGYTENGFGDQQIVRQIEGWRHPQ